MFDWLIRLWRNWFWTPQDHFEEFCRQNSIELNGDYGFAINGLLVSEFGYLLRLVSAGRFERFDSLRAMYNDRQQILYGITHELQLEQLTEERLVTHETAVFNMKNLQGIVRKIFAMVEMADKLGVALPGEA
ncbi:MAG: hypothetical protein ACK4F8_15035 [Aquabacterium sp.]